MAQPGPARSGPTGVTAGLLAYGIWGLLPLYFHLVRDIGAAEILAHRIVWALVVVSIVLRVRGTRRWWRSLARRELAALVAGGLLIGANWLTYIWATTNGHVVEAALGYYINPLLTVALGVGVLREQLSRAQAVALVLALGAVGVLTAAYGRVPWVAIALATTFALYSLIKKQTDLGAVRALAVETAVLAPAALAGLAVLTASGNGSFGGASFGQDAALIGLGVVTATPLVAFGTATRTVSLSQLGLMQYLSPTIQMVCGVAILGEPLPADRLAGFALVWAALGVLAVDLMRPTRRSVPLSIETP